MTTPATAADFEVAVIGAGPAGAAAARLLASWGHDVILIGRPPHTRPIAESLPPSCVKLFDRIGVRGAIDSGGFIRATGNTVKWAGGDTRIERFDAAVPGYQVRRDLFDDLLSNAAAGAGATFIRDASVRRVERTGDWWEISYDGAPAAGAVRSRLVLDCSGRSGVVARRGLRRPEAAARTIAVIGVWEHDGPWPTEDDTHTLVESFDGGWAWSVPVEDGRRYVTVMLDPSATALPGRDRLVQAYRAELARAPMLADLVGDATLVDAPWGADASPYSAHRASDDGLFLVGDAASFVDPLSSFGVKKALASAWLAAVACHSIVGDPSIAGQAHELFDRREREMYERLQRQSAALSREAAGTHATDFWNARTDATLDDATGELDAVALRTEPRVVAAFEELKRRDAVRLRLGDRVEVRERPVVRGNRIVLDRHLVAPDFPAGARFCRNVDLYVMSQLAVQHDQVPDLFDAYNRAAPPAPLPDFLGALSTLIGLDVLRFT